MKVALVEQVRRELKSRLDTLSRAAREAHDAATDPGSRAESKYDTRSLEASYLASGQIRQLEELAASLAVFEGLKLPSFAAYQAVDAGALVEVDTGSSRARFLLVPAAGGMELGEGADSVTLLSPESPLYQKLSGCYVGDSIDGPHMTVISVA